MKGLLFAGQKRVRVVDFPIPDVGEGEVLIKMKASAICGSDMHVYGLKPDEEVPWSVDFDKIPGHEPCGVVEKIGEGVGALKPGDRVIVYHFEGCGACCYCLSGDYQYCKDLKIYGGNKNGADAEFMVAKARCCLKLPNELSFTEGVLLSCNAGSSYEAIKQLELSAVHRVAVYGLGPVGLTAIIIAKAIGAFTIGVDIIDERVRLAEDAGVDLAVNGAKKNPVDEIMKSTGGTGADAAIECSGSPIAQRNALDSLKPYGKVALVGVNLGKLILKPTEQILLKQSKIIGVRMFNIRTYPEMVKFTVEHQLPLTEVVTHRFGIEQAQQAFRLYETGKTGKMIFIF